MVKDFISKWAAIFLFSGVFGILLKKWHSLFGKKVHWFYDDDFLSKVIWISIPLGLFLLLIRFVFY